MQTLKPLVIPYILQTKKDDDAEEREFTVVELGRKIDMSDLKNKCAQFANMVKKKNTPLKVIVKVMPTSKDDIVKAGFLIDHIADQLAGTGIIRKIKEVQRFPAEDEEENEVKNEEEEGETEMEERAQAEREKIDLEDTPDKKQKMMYEKEEFARARLGYVAVEVIPRTNKEQALTLEAVIKRMGPVDEFLKKAQRFSNMYFLHSTQ